MELEKFACPNSACPDYGRRNAGNIAQYTQYGRKRVRLLVCKTCNKTFSELKGTPFWDSRLDWETIENIYQSLLEGKGIRATARRYNLSKNTVKRYLRMAKREPETIEAFLFERGVSNNDGHTLRDLVKRFSSGQEPALAASSPIPAWTGSTTEA